MSFEMLFFPFWEWTINVLRDTNEFNIDSLLCFKTHIFYSRELLFTRRWAIDSDGVACLVEISLVVRVVLLAICFLCFAFCLVGCNPRWDLSVSDNDYVHLQLGTALNLHFKCFSPKQFLASLKLCRDFPPNRRGCCHIWWSSDQYNNSETPTASSAPCGGYCLSAPK